MRKTIFLIMLLVIVSSCDYRSVKSNDVQDVAKKVLDLPQLQQYFHVNRFPDRKPLIIVKDSSITEKLRLMKFGVPVRFLNQSKIERDNIQAYIKFMTFVVQNEAAYVMFSYPVEGMIVRVKLTKKQDGSWVIIDSAIVEQ